MDAVAAVLIGLGGGGCSRGGAGGLKIFGGVLVGFIVAASGSNASF